MIKSKTSAGPEFFTAFATAWGPIGVVGRAGEVARVVLPHYQMADLLALLQWEHPQAQSSDEPFAEFIAASRAYFNGTDAGALLAVPCVLPSAGSFAGKVSRACRAIPFGQTRSYRELAVEIGNPDAARAVATIMSKNKTPLLVPCHRVIYSNGKPGGFSAEAGQALKLRMMRHEKTCQ